MPRVCNECDNESEVDLLSLHPEKNWSITGSFCAEHALKMKRKRKDTNKWYFFRDTLNQEQVCRELVHGHAS